MNPEIQVEELPGIGRRFQFVSDTGEILTVVIHNSGRRDLYVANEREGEPVALTMTDRQAHRIGDLLSGDYSAPSEVSEVQRVVNDMVVEWVALKPGSPAAGRSLADLSAHELTGVTLMCLVRGDAVIDDPGYEHTLKAGDRLIVAGRREKLGMFRRIVVGGNL